MTRNKISNETINNTLLGIAIGDAFGAGLEFQDRNWIKENVDFTEFIDTRESEHKTNYQPGYYTDDTEHSLALTRALMSRRNFSKDLLVEYFKKEYEIDKAKKGFGRAGHGSIKHYYEGNKTIEEIRNEQKNRLHPGNAPPMRVVPLGFINENLIYSYAVLNADATHPHNEARMASVVIAKATEYILIKKGEQKDIIKNLNNYVWGEQAKKILEQTDKLPLPEELTEKDYEVLCGPQPIPYLAKEKNFILYGLPCESLLTATAAVYILKHSNNAFEGLKNSINLGGDVDSIAAITTGILAGKYGLDSLPEFMKEQTEGKEKIKELAEKFHKYLTKK